MMPKGSYGVCQIINDPDPVCDITVSWHPNGD